MPPTGGAGGEPRIPDKQTCRVARPPKAALVTRLRSRPVSNPTARQRPGLSTTIWVGPPSTGDCANGASLARFARSAETRCTARRSSLEQSKKPDLEIVHTLTPLSLTIATASLAPAHCVAAAMSLLPRVETEVTLPAVASKYTAAPTANVTVAAFGNCHTPPSVTTGNVCSAS